MSYPEVSRLAGTCDSVTEALCAALRVCCQQSEVSRLAPVTTCPRHVSLAVTVATALSTHRACQGAGTGLAVGVPPVAQVTPAIIGSVYISSCRRPHLPVTARPRISREAETVPCLVSCVALLIVRVTLGRPFRPRGVTLASHARPRVKPGDPCGSIVTRQTALAVDSVRLVPAVDADSTTGVFPCSVEAPSLRLDLGVKVAFVSVAEALAPLALVPGDELPSGPPSLVEHGAAGVTELAACVVSALTLIVPTRAHPAVAGVSMTGTLSSDGNVFECVEIFPGHVAVLRVLLIR